MDLVCAAFIKVKFAILVQTTGPRLVLFCNPHKFTQHDWLITLFAVWQLRKINLDPKKKIVVFSLRNICILCESAQDSNSNRKKYINM